MSIQLPLCDLNETQQNQIKKDLVIELKPSIYSLGAPSQFIFLVLQKNDTLMLPFGYSKHTLHLPRPERKSFPPITPPLKFQGHLRPNQKKVLKEALGGLNSYGCVIISAYTGFGKTFSAIKIATTIKLKTLIIVNKLILMNQWKKSLQKTCPEASVCVLKSGGGGEKTLEKEKGHHFYIINAMNVHKYPEDLLNSFGLVIVDECHLIMAKTPSRCLQHVFPRYLIGLSATPYRPDGLNQLLDLYFGPVKVVRELNKKHLVYKVNTGFKPLVDFTIQGRVNWGVILESQAGDVKRNELIVSIVQRFSDRVFLILTKRVDQIDLLYGMFKTENIDVDTLSGSKKDFDVHARVLIGTISKIGTGFDHPAINALILAADVKEYFIQYLGRCMRRPDQEPIIFDLVDDNPILKRHYTTRKKVYIKHGGVIQTYK